MKLRIIRVIRGDSWLYDDWFCRDADRFWGRTALRLSNVGFRVLF